MPLPATKLRVCLFLTIAILSIFWQVQDHGFVNFDDDLYVTANPRVQAGLTVDNIVWAFTTTHASNWHPLTWLSHMVDCHLFGLNPGAHHFTNLLLHVANTLLLFLVFHRMTRAVWKSAFVAALFAVHPLHVESVAWVAERKDLLSTFFWLLTMGLYLRYVKRPGYTPYLLVFLSFSLGLMAKPMLVSLPFVLLLLDYWPLGRLEFVPSSLTTQPQTAKSTVPWSRWSLILRLVLEKVPLLGLTTVSSIVTFLAQRSGGALESLNTSPLNVRLANAFVTYVRYMEKTIWPHDLAVFYPHSGRSLPVWQAAGAVLLLLSITVLVLRTVRSHPYLTTGWLWYLGTLVPVIGIVQVGAHALADRYTYVPLIGLFIVMAWGLSDILAKWPHRRAALATLTAGLLVAFMICSRIQVRYWQNSTTLFQHTLNVTTNNWLAHNNMGNALARQGRLGEAANHYSQALEIKPNYPRAHNNLGIALAQHGKTDEAISHYAVALRIKPDFAAARYNLGNALAQQGKLENAIAHYMEALRTEPDFAEAHNNYAMVLAQQGKLDEAVSHFEEALRIKPDFQEARHNLAIALQKGDKYGTAPKSLDVRRQRRSNPMASLQK
jgi:tetratricopeptide (TPR) repeat protein